MKTTKWILQIRTESLTDDELIDQLRNLTRQPGIQEIRIFTKTEGEIFSEGTTFTPPLTIKKGDRS